MGEIPVKTPVKRKVKAKKPAVKKPAATKPVTVPEPVVATLNPIALQADKAALQAIRDKANVTVSGRMKELLPVLSGLFKVAMNEKRTPTADEIEAAVLVRGGNEPQAFSNDNDGQRWYVVNKLVPLVTLMAAGVDKASQVALLRAYLFEQEYFRQLPTTKVDELLSEGDGW